MVALGGIYAIYTQTEATKTAAEATAQAATATARSAKASEDSVKLQEVSLRQWLNIGHWEVWLEDGTKRLRIRFHIINPTHLPIDLESFSLETSVMSADPENEGPTELNQVLPPENPRIVDAAVEFGDKWIGVVKTKALVIMNVKCTVFFGDVRKQLWEQTFERYVLVTKKVLHDEPTTLKTVVPHVREIKNYLRAREQEQGSGALGSRPPVGR